LISNRHIAAVAVAVAALCCIAVPAVAAANQSGTGDGSVAQVNEHLASLVAGEQPPARHGGVLAKNPAARFSAVTSPSPIHLAPILLQLAGRYNRAERLLHFQSNGFDANFWGLAGRGRIRLRYSVKF
jgi:hypothetical protein